jgi:hypothetical protein
MRGLPKDPKTIGCLFVVVVLGVVLVVMWGTRMQSSGKRKATVITMRAEATEAGVTLVWNANPEPDIAGYVLYYGTVSHTYTSNIPVAATSQMVTVSLGPGTYFFAVTAKNTLGVESAYSAEVSAQVLPPPTATPGPTPFPSPTSPPTPVPTFVAAGRVLSCTTGTGVADVVVTISGSVTASTLTDSTGHYSFDLAQGGSYTVTPTHANLPPASPGINTVDVLAIVRNYLLGNPLACPSAGDVNLDGRIDTVDVLATQKFILTQPGTAHVGEFIFSPVSAPAGASQDFVGTVPGDCQ